MDIAASKHVMFISGAHATDILNLSLLVPCQDFCDYRVVDAACVSTSVCFWLKRILLFQLTEMLISEVTMN